MGGKPRLYPQARVGIARQNVRNFCKHVPDGVAAPRDGDGLPLQRKAVDPTRPTPLLRPYVNNRLRERVFAREKGSPCRAYQLGALALASGPVSDVTGSPYVLLGLALLLALVTGLVIVPAIWSRRAARRKAALDVLDRLLRWKG